jgi:cytochrome c-type biogenesis protein
MAVVMPVLMPVIGVGDWFESTVLSGSLLLALPVAAVAGLVSFFSPCVVPLLPGYLSYATGLSGADLASARRGRMVLGSLLFVLGFTFVFVALGTASGALGEALWVYNREITVVLGIVTIVLGVAFLGFVPWMQRDIRVHRVPAVGLAAAPLLGVVFGLGWTPCIGPTLGAVSSLAMSEGTAGRGALLSVAYSLGLGLPFLVAGLSFRRMLGAVSWVRRHQVWVTRVGGVMLIGVGVLLLTGLWDLWVADLRGWIGGFETAV